MDYAVTITPDDNDTFLVTFPDVPGAITYGATIDEALARAVDALAAMLETHIKDHDPIPVASTIRSKYRVAVPALIEAKVLLYQAMRTAKVGKAELGRRLRWHGPQVDRLLAMKHGSKLDQLEAAFGALGKRLVIEVVEDATTRGAATRPKHRRPSASAR